jgi:predicted nucleic acid-binding protein
MVVSDATPITTLPKARQVNLPQKLFGSVTIPETIFEELRAFHAVLPNFIRVQAFAGGHPREVRYDLCPRPLIAI